MLLVSCGVNRTNTSTPADVLSETSDPHSAVVTAGVVAEGSCWVLRDPAEPRRAGDTRLDYAQGRLQRIERFSTDGKTVVGYDELGYDERARLVSRRVWSATPLWQWMEATNPGSAQGHHLLSTSWAWVDAGIQRHQEHLGGILVAEEIVDQRDAFGHPTVTTRFNKVDGRKETRTLRWTPTPQGGWTIEVPTKVYSAGRPVERMTETITIDRRARVVASRSPRRVEQWTWDEDDRCVAERIYRLPPEGEAPSATPDVRFDRDTRERPRRETITRVDHRGTLEIELSFDANGNLVERRTPLDVTRFRYEGEFRNAWCDHMEPPQGEPWRRCDLSSR